MSLLRGLSLFAVVTAGALALAGGGPAQGVETPRVLGVEFDNDVNPVTQDYLNEAIDRGAEEGFEAVVIVMDTPGGLGSSMREIIKKILDSEVPVVVYVAPPGSSADSAGAFIALAADVAAMAPQTNIGSSTPVSVGGDEISDDLRKKIVNDAAAYIRELAEEHDRNGDVAEDFVREATNLGAREALDQNVVDVIAEDLPSLLDEIDGRRTIPKGIVLNTADAEIETIQMSLWKQILDTLIDPNLIVVLMSLGLLGITIEILNPGLIFPGTVGVISLIVGLFGLQVLPVSWAGVLLLLLAAAFFVAEALVASHGALTLAGAVSFIIGSLLLFDPAGEAYQVSIWVALAVGLTLSTAVGLAIAKIVDVRRTKPQTGEEEMLGDVGVVRQALDPEGYVFIHGELWRARADNGSIAAGEHVEVVRIGEGLVLEVKPSEGDTGPVAPTPAART